MIGKSFGEDDFHLVFNVAERIDPRFVQQDIESFLLKQQADGFRHFPKVILRFFFQRHELRFIRCRVNPLIQRNFLKIQRRELLRNVAVDLNLRADRFLDLRFDFAFLLGDGFLQHFNIHINPHSVNETGLART